MGLDSLYRPRRAMGCRCSTPKHGRAQEDLLLLVVSLTTYADHITPKLELSLPACRLGLVMKVSKICAT